MNNDKTDHLKMRVLKLILVSAISFIIGGSWAWFTISEGGPEALGAIIPLFGVGGVHLVTGPLAINIAFRLQGIVNCTYVYLYFGSFLLITFLLFPPEILVYIIIFIVLTISPLLFYMVLGMLKKLV